jgi:hypothetical protein
MRLPEGAAGVFALGWATVELDRAARELAAELGLAPGAFAAAAASLTLGARCRVAYRVLPGGLSLAILEPATEGRLAATLARSGEGPAVAWHVAEDAVLAGSGAQRAGPFGPERLVSGDPLHGPHRFLIGPRTGTIPP